jgi:hypothetical protein
MKKFVLLLVLCCAFGLVMPASAQIRLGVIGGLNLARLNAGADPGLDSFISNLTAFAGGGVMQFRLTENLALQLEPMYLQKGARVEGSFGDSDSDSSLWRRFWRGRQFSGGQEFDFCSRTLCARFGQHQQRSR